MGQARRLDLEDLVRCRHVAGVVEMDITRDHAVAVINIILVMAIRMGLFP